MDYFCSMKRIFYIIVILSALIALFWAAFQAQNVDYGELLSLNISIQTTIVVTTFTFVLVSIQLASVQFSPRILRNFFAKDKKIGLILALFVCNIAYCLILKLLGLKSEEHKIFPIIGLIYGISLVAIVLPLFFSYITNAMNVGTITQKIALQVLKNIDENYDTEDFTPEISNSNWTIFPQTAIKANGMGYLQSIDYAVVNYVAEKYKDAFFKSTQIVGTFIQPNETLITMFGRKDNPLTDAEKILLQNAFRIGKYRSVENDLNYGIRQLVDIAIKAISPAVNDPTTAINCLNYIGVIVHSIGNQAFPSMNAQDLLPNISIKEPDFKHIVNHSFDQIYFWGKGDPIVVLAILNTIHQIIGDLDNPEHRQILLDEVKDMEIDSSVFSPEQRNLIEKALKKII